VQVFVPARPFFELALLANRIGLRTDPWQAGLNYLLLLSACFFFGLIREIYGHDKDPHENVNAAAEPEYEQDVEPLSQMLKQGWHAALPG